jgi:transposase
MLDHTLKPEMTARRLEVITEMGRRRWFFKDDKTRVVEETLLPGAVVSEIARRHGLIPQQVFTWRRQARQSSTRRADEVRFVPAVVDAVVPARALGRECKAVRCKAKADSGIIEIEVDGITIRAGHRADPTMIASIVQAPPSPGPHPTDRSPARLQRPNW